MAWLRVILPALGALFIPFMVLFLLLAWVAMAYVRGPGWFGWLVHTVSR